MKDTNLKYVFILLTEQRKSSRSTDECFQELLTLDRKEVIIQDTSNRCKKFSTYKIVLINGK